MATLAAEMAGGTTRVRMASAVVALVPTLAAIHFGSPYFGLFILTGCLILGWEWGRLCGFSSTGLPILIVHAAAVSASVAAILGRIDLSFGLIFLGAMGSCSAVLLTRQRITRNAGESSGTTLVPGWVGTGILYFGLPAVLLIWLRDVGGRETVLWLFMLVWATDTGAFVFGKLIGGPKLAPSISPKKTWAGLFGGVLCAASLGAIFAFAVGHSALSPLAVLSGVLAVVAQGGDLFESWVKRRIGVKDAGSIMPGHGGLLDRVDGLLAVAVLVTAIAYFGGESGLVWL